MTKTGNIPGDFVAFIMQYTTTIAKMDSTTEEAKIGNAIAAVKETIEKADYTKLIPLPLPQFRSECP